MPYPAITRIKSIAALITIVVLLNACSGDNNGNEQFSLKQVNKSLTESSAFIKSQSDAIYQLLERKIINQASASAAGPWRQHAAEARQLSDSMRTHINNLKERLINRAQFDPFSDEKQSYRSASDVVAKLFKEQKEGQLLHEKLAMFKRNLLDLNDEIRAAFYNGLSITGSDQVSKPSVFTNKYFNGSVAGALSTLNRIENEINIAENKLTVFCNDKTLIPDGQIFFDTYSAIVSQSAYTLKPGEELQIVASLSAFPKAAMPAITFDGQPERIPISDPTDNETPGAATHRFKVPVKPGEYSIPVRVHYVTQNGQQHIVEKIVRYVVQ